MAQTITRRTFAAAAVTAAGAGVLNTFAAHHESRSMFKNLGAGHIRVSGDMKKIAQYAQEFGYGGFNPSVGDIMKMSKAERDEFVSWMKEHNLRWGASGLPVDFRKDDGAFKDGLKTLPEQAKALESVGVDRVSTWILPFHAELTYLQNFNQHRERLRECALVLKDHGMRLGLEFVGPQTMLVRERFPFAHTQPEMLELCHAIDTGNMGLLLDSWHWHSSHGTLDELAQLTNDLVVNVHVNDAPAGVPINELNDFERELPCASGVIDMKGFMKALASMNYDGPVTVEPFNQPLWDMEDRDALKATIESLDCAFGYIDA